MPAWSRLSAKCLRSRCSWGCKGLPRLSWRGPCVTFFALLGLVVVEAVQNSPCIRKMAQNRCFMACRESFVPVSPAGAACRESFVPGGPPGARAGRVLYRRWFRMRYKIRPARLGGGGSGTKFSLHSQNGPKSVFCGVPGEFCTGIARRGRVLGEFCRGWVADRGVLGDLFRGPAAVGSCRANLWCLDEGCVPPLDVGHAHTPRSRVSVALDVGFVSALRSRVRLPLGARVGTSLRPHAAAFPQDSGDFPSTSTNPYM